MTSNRFQPPSRQPSYRCCANHAFLATSPTVPIGREEVETRVSHKQQTMPEIPVSQFARILTRLRGLVPFLACHPL
jgi:hypothetical protein